ncbi:TPA: hypothetical protein L2F63_004659, partial [Escherichia coli O25b:H4-ST131]|nr:hypothetical protein [Escherichia coli O25b:H4-ST131]
KLHVISKRYTQRIERHNRGVRANGTKTYVKEIIRCLYLNLELSVPLLKYPLAT